MTEKLLQEIKKRTLIIVQEKLSDFSAFKDAIKSKEDQSVVTEIDLEISSFMQELLRGECIKKQAIFFSEENFKTLTFPAFILDPIDGTKELIKGIGECCLSLAFMNSCDLNDPQNIGFIYNPFSGFDIVTGQKFIRPFNQKREKLMGFVSRSEFTAGLYQSDDHDLLNIIPRGSIALKLGLLAAGACDFVYSKRPKSIWDIAAGALLCDIRGIKMYASGQEKRSLEAQRLEGPLLWCAPENRETILRGIRN